MKRGTDRTGPVSFEKQRQLVDNEPTDINHYFLPSNDLNPQKGLKNEIKIWDSVSGAESGYKIKLLRQRQFFNKQDIVV